MSTIPDGQIPPMTEGTDSCPAKRPTWRCGLSLILFLVLFGLAVSFYLKQRKLTMNFNQQQQAMLQVAQHIANLDDMQKQQMQINHTLTKNLFEVGQQQKLSGSASANLIDSEYLVKMAFYQLTMLHAVDSAKQLLAMADALIQRIPGERANAARQALAQDRAALNAIPPVSIEQLLQLINQLHQLTDRLSLPQPAIVATETVSATAKQSGFDWHQWRSYLLSVWQQLEKFIVIRHHTGNTPELLAPDAQAYLLQNIHLLLQQVSWAVLNQQTSVYKTSLNEITDDLDRYFGEQSQATTAMREIIQRLQATNIAPAVPDLTQTVTLLTELKQATLSPTRVIAQ